MENKANRLKKLLDDLDFDVLDFLQDKSEPPTTEVIAGSINSNSFFFVFDEGRGSAEIKYFKSRDGLFWNGHFVNISPDEFLNLLPSEYRERFLYDLDLFV